jgi:hypothetical protein
MNQRCSSGEGARARDDVGGRRRVGVDVDGEALVGRRVRRHGDLRRVGRATASDGDLRAGRVPLRGVHDVEADLLDLDEVLCNRQQAELCICDTKHVRHPQGCPRGEWS